MKKSILKIGLVLLAVVCMIGMFAVTATADETPTALIAGHNLSLNDNIYIIYYAKFENAPANAEKGVLVWTSQQESYEYGTQYAILPVYTGNNYGYDAYYFTGVSAKMMTQDIYAKSYVKIGDKITYGELDKYSVLQYCYNKTGSTTKPNGSTIALGELIQDILHYGASAQKYFNFNPDRLATANYYEIKVVGGTLPDGTTQGLFPAGAHVTLIATVEGFNHWENKIGELLGSEQMLLVTVSGNETYTAANQVIAHTHAWDAGVVTTEPACTKEGVKTYTCSICSITKTEAIPALGHNYDEDGICTTCGKEQESDGLVYTLNANNQSYSVTGIGNCTDEVVYIASSYNGLPVTTIGEKAFADQTAITGIVIPTSVTTIGKRAFYNTGLTEIRIPESVTSIGTQIFYKANNLATVYYDSPYLPSGTTNQFLSNASIKKIVFGKNANLYYTAERFGLQGNVTEIEIPDSLTSIASYAFQGCSALTNIEIPDSVTSIGYGAFFGCSALTSIEIPDSVTSIGYEAFRDCSSLTSIEIPDGVTSIGNYAFQNCSALTSIEIPDSVTSIGYGAFFGCSALTGVYITDLAKWYEISFGSGNANPLCYAHNLYLNGELVTDLVFPDSVTSIGKYAFSGCTSLTSIEIPDSVTSIGGWAFSGCTSLTSIEIPDSVTSIGNGAFSDCSKLTSIEIPDGVVTSIGWHAFYYCSSLTSIEIPASVTSIGESAFETCTALTSITYTGSIAQWNAISKGNYWNSGTGSYTIHCTDGDIAK